MHLEAEWWNRAQHAYHECSERNATLPRREKTSLAHDAQRRFVVWTSTSALGNALVRAHRGPRAFPLLDRLLALNSAQLPSLGTQNIFAYGAIIALVTNRSLLSGNGKVPMLFCGPEGAFECGIPSATSDQLKSAVSFGRGSWGDTIQSHPQAQVVVRGPLWHLSIA